LMVSTMPTSVMTTAIASTGFMANECSEAV
jgi:hypothetical protein